MYFVVLYRVVICCAVVYCDLAYCAVVFCVMLHWVFLYCVVLCVVCCIDMYCIQFCYIASNVLCVFVSMCCMTLHLAALRFFLCCLCHDAPIFQTFIPVVHPFS